MVKQATTNSIRTCVGCGQQEHKTDLLRWVLVDGKITLDWLGTFPGRAVYTHPEPRCVKAFYNRKTLPSAFLKGTKRFSVSADAINSRIFDLAVRSFRHFCSLGIKSGTLIIGQSSIEAASYPFSFIFSARDTAENTTKKIVKSKDSSIITLPFDKADLGQFLTGRPVGVCGVRPGTIAKKLHFYSKVLTHFFAGAAHEDT